MYGAEAIPEIDKQARRPRTPATNRRRWKIVETFVENQFEIRIMIFALIAWFGIKKACD